MVLQMPNWDSGWITVPTAGPVFSAVHPYSYSQAHNLGTTDLFVYIVHHFSNLLGQQIIGFNVTQNTHQLSTQNTWPWWVTSDSIYIARPYEANPEGETRIRIWRIL